MATIKTLAIFLAPALALCACGLRRTTSPVNQKTSPMQWNGASCPITQSSERLITNAQDWEKLWKDIGQKAPAADFNADFAVAVFLGTRPTGGYGVIFQDAATENGQTVARYAVKSPKGMAIEVLTQPYAVRLYPRTNLPARIERITEGH